MGFGRHRTAIHGVPSKREQAERRGKAGDATRVARLERRVAELERPYDSLVKGLPRTAGSAKGKRKLPAELSLDRECARRPSQSTEHLDLRSRLDRFIVRSGGASVGQRAAASMMSCRRSS